MITSALLVAVVLRFAPADVPSVLPPVPSGQEWRIVWHDEFDGATLDDSKWERMDCPRREAFWSKDDAYLDGKGSLILRTQKAGDRFSSGAVRTKGKFEHRYGYWECRCQFPKQQGHWPAFWMMPVAGLPDGESGGVAGTEIDIMEKAYQTDKMNHALHWDGYGAHHKSAVQELEGLGLNEGFHTFGLWWTPEEYVFYVDGKETWRTKAGGPSQAMSYAKLTEEIGPWAGKITEAVLPDYFTVDYVRVYDMAEAASGKTPEQLRDVHRIVFLGDSITQAGDYVTDVDCWLVSKGLNVDVLNLGLGSETATDLTDAENDGHQRQFGFGRPSISERLNRVLTATKPDILFACYGMNDGGSLPADDTGMARFSEAVTNLREAALNAGVRRVVLCTPPVHDSKGNEALKTPDENLTRYSEWLLTKKADGWDVVDIHGPMRKALDAARANDPAFVFAADGVHPGREGHWLMAQAILQQFFGAKLDGVSSADQLFDKDGSEIRTLVRQRMDVLFAGWMTKIGHKRPGVTGAPDAAPGPSIEEATAKAAELTTRILGLCPPVAKGEFSANVDTTLQLDPNSAWGNAAADGAGVFGAYAPSTEYTPPKDPAVLKKLCDWQDQKLGLLLTWGIYSQWGIVESWTLCPERYEWNKRTGPYANDDRAYKASYEELINTFNPVKFDPAKWAAAFSGGGVKYVLVMAKHHDGFCMFDTETTDYRITSPRCPFHTDPRANVLKEMSEAFRKEGLSTGVYFSKADWNSPYYWSPDFPLKDRNVNYNTSEHPDLWAKFKDFTWRQIEELMSGYGPQDVLWLDGGQVRPPDQDIDATGMAAMARKHQPGLIVVDRTVRGENENYVTPEQEIPDHYLPYPWETCMTMGTAWPWKPNDQFKSAGALIHTLCTIVARGGNLLLGIGPDANGEFDPTVYSRLEEMGKWLKLNGEAIYATRPIAPYEQNGCVFTQKRDGTVYAIILPKEDNDGLPESVSLPKEFAEKAGSLTLLGFGPLEVGPNGAVAIPPAARTNPPCAHVWVVKITSG